MFIQGQTLYLLQTFPRHCRSRTIVEKLVIQLFAEIAADMGRDALRQGFGDGNDVTLEWSPNEARDSLHMGRLECGAQPKGTAEGRREATKKAWCRRTPYPAGR
jgi:hypothetical protein